MKTKECKLYKSPSDKELNIAICEKDGNLTDCGSYLYQDEKRNWYCPKGKGIIEYDRLIIKKKNRIRMH